VSRFYDRERITLAEAKALMAVPSNTIDHLLANDDGTYSVMSHIVCEFCDYCQAGKAAEPHSAKPDPYELVGRE
jgi:hypothetical protein